jgi:GrpB-like predicted nucleotidyltransferase (UPF0157 family)
MLRRSRTRPWWRLRPVGSRREYEQLKRQLTVHHADNRQAHTDGKSAMVATITADARRWIAARRRR